MTAPRRSPSARATERVAVLMTPSEKLAYAERASRLGLSLGQFFREAGAAYTAERAAPEADLELLEAALCEMERSTRRTEQVLDEALREVRAGLQVS